MSILLIGELLRRAGGKDTREPETSQVPCFSCAERHGAGPGGLRTRWCGPRTWQRRGAVSHRRRRTDGYLDHSAGFDDSAGLDDDRGPDDVGPDVDLGPGHFAHDDDEAGRARFSEPGQELLRSGTRVDRGAEAHPDVTDRRPRPAGAVRAG